jgi:hypothetical protein
MAGPSYSHSFHQPGIIFGVAEIMKLAIIHCSPIFSQNFAPNPINEQHGDVVNEFKTYFVRVPLRRDFDVIIYVCFDQ